MLWWYTASRSGHHMLDRPDSSLSEELQQQHSDADGKVSSLGFFDASSIKTSSSAAATKGSWVKAGNKCAPGTTWTRPRTQNFPRNTIQTCSAIGTRQETQQHVAQSQLSPRSRGTRAVAEQRLSHHTTPVRTTHGAVCPAEPSSRICCAARSGACCAWALYRVLHAHRPCKRDLRRCRQTSALVSRWSEVLAVAGARVVHARARPAITRPRPGIQISSMSRRCLAEPMRVIQ